MIFNKINRFKNKSSELLQSFNNIITGLNSQNNEIVTEIEKNNSKISKITLETREMYSIKEQNEKIINNIEKLIL